MDSTHAAAAAATPPMLASARRNRPPVALPKDFEALDRTHRQAMHMLQAFDGLLQHVDDNGPDATAQACAAEILEFFGGLGRNHHADEETLVFPRLLTSGDEALVQHVRRLLQDHGWIEEDWRVLMPQVEAIATGYSWYDLPMLRLALPVFTALYHEHIALEETVVYPAARAMLQGDVRPAGAHRAAVG